MTDEELDSLMKRVLIDSIKLDLDAEDKLSAIDFEPSHRHQRQMKAMLRDPLGWARKKTRPVWKTAIQRVAIILLAISLGFGAIMVASPTARAAFTRWIREWYETHITYRYTGERTLDAMPRYEIAELPEGYFEYERVEKKNYTLIIYQNADSGEWISLHYTYMQQGFAIDFMVESEDIVPITVHRMAGELYLSKNLEEEDSTITWIDAEANLQFVVDAPFGREDILQIAESVFQEENGK